MNTEYKQLSIDFSNPPEAESGTSDELDEAKIEPPYKPEDLVSAGNIAESANLVESDARFPLEPPDYIYIFPPGIEICRNEGSPMGVVGNKSKPDGSKEDLPLVAICQSEKVVGQKPLFACLGLRTIFIPGARPDSNYLTLGGERVLFRVAKSRRLKGKKRLTAWKVWVEEMKKIDSSLDDLETHIANKVGKGERFS